jgi:hypothetical protein
VVAVVLGVGEQLDKVVQVAEVLVVTMVEQLVMEHKETPVGQVVEMALVQEVAEDVVVLVTVDKVMVEDQVEMVVHISHTEVQLDIALAVAAAVRAIIMEPPDMLETVVVVEDVLEIIQVVQMHKMVVLEMEAVPVVEQLINGQIHPVIDVPQMVEVEKLLLDGNNRIKSKNIIWDILQK